MNKTLLGGTDNVERIQSLIEQEGPFLSLSQAARQTGIPLQTPVSYTHLTLPTSDLV